MSVQVYEYCSDHTSTQTLNTPHPFFGGIHRGIALCVAHTVRFSELSTLVKSSFWYASKQTLPVWSTRERSVTDSVVPISSGANFLDVKTSCMCVGLTCRAQLRCSAADPGECACGRKYLWCRPLEDLETLMRHDQMLKWRHDTVSTYAQLCEYTTSTKSPVCSLCWMHCWRCLLQLGRE